MTARPPNRVSGSLALGLLLAAGAFAPFRVTAAPRAALRLVLQDTTPQGDAGAKPDKNQGAPGDPTPTPRPAPAPGVVRTATEDEKKAAAAAIEAQLKAFRSDDYAAAMRYQSGGLRRDVGSVTDFRQMMRRQYPQFVNYREVEFREARASQDGHVVEVKIVLTGMDRVIVRATYAMVREQNEYRVLGVTPVRPPNPRDFT